MHPPRPSLDGRAMWATSTTTSHRKRERAETGRAAAAAQQIAPVILSSDFAETADALWISRCVDPETGIIVQDACVALEMASCI